MFVLAAGKIAALGAIAAASVVLIATLLRGVSRHTGDRA
jgi:hypothetical protein